jgi:hypothetical protein
MQALFLLVIAFAVCFGVTAQGAQRVPLGKGPAASASSERGQKVNRQSDDPAPDDENDVSEMDVDDGDEKFDAWLAPPSIWVGRTARSGPRLIQVPKRMWRSSAQRSVALPRAPPALG